MSNTDLKNKSTTRLRRAIKRLPVMLGLMGAGVVVAAIATAAIDDDPGTSTVIGTQLVIPYEGFVQIDGAPLEATRQMRFELYDAPSGGSPVWAEEQSVLVRRGQFSVGLGNGTRDMTINIDQTLGSIVLDGEKLFLGMKVEDVSAGCVPVPPAVTCWVDLAGRQAIEPAVQTAWAVTSTEMEVNRDVQIAGDANVTTRTEIAGTLSTDVVDTDPNMGPIRLTVNNTEGLWVKGDTVGLRDQRPALQIDGATDELVVNPGGAFGSFTTVGTRVGSGVQSPLRVEGKTRVEGFMDFNGLHLTMRDSANTIYRLTARDDAAFDTTGIELRPLSDPGNRPLFQVADATGSSLLTINNQTAAQVSRDLVTASTAGISGSLDATGHITVTGDVQVGGKINALTKGSEQIQDASATRDLGVSVSDGFCYLSYFYVSHGDSGIDEMSCDVSINGSNQWELISASSDSEGDGDANCRATCVTY